MTLEPGKRIFSQFPVGNTANAAGPLKPLVSKPAGRPAVSGITDQECLVTMSRDPRLITDDIDRSDAM
jgi:hypothetical protein